MQVNPHALEQSILMLVPKKSRISMKEMEVLAGILFVTLCTHREGQLKQKEEKYPKIGCG